ncbi:MAG: FAD:protein FMN transferase [Bacteroidetes bacterium]|nr:MAG: FAD:protein FMN transferase [Bacteroidota bacterium]
MLLARYVLTVALFTGWLGTLLPGQPVSRYSFSAPHMGTTFRLVLYAPDSLTAARAAAAAWEEVARLNAIMSDYQRDSELNRLSATAGQEQWVTVSPPLWEVLSYAQQISRRTRGAFDVTVGPLSRLWRRAFRQGELPDSAAMAQARAVTGYQYLWLDASGQRVQLAQAGMRLDLGGIAKGYTADRLLALLADAHGLHQVLVDAGGDLRIGDPPPARAGWEVLLPGPDSQQLVLANCAIATSGDTYRYLERGGTRFSHIIDPRSGWGMSQRRLVTVIAPTGMCADAWASALSVVSLRRPGRWLRPRRLAPSFFRILGHPTLPSFLRIQKGRY